MNEEDDEGDTGGGGARYPVMPSLIALQQIRNRKHLALLGKKLMKWTALAAGRELRTIAAKIDSVYKTYKQDLGNAYMQLARCRYYAPELNPITLQNISRSAYVTVDPDVKYVSGVATISYVIQEDQDNKPYPYLGLSKGGMAIQECKEAWLELLKVTITMVSLRKTFVAVEKAHRSATKRQNVLSKVILPRLNNTSKYVTIELEDLSREEIHRIKMVKQMKSPKHKKEEPKKEPQCLCASIIEEPPQPVDPCCAASVTSAKSKAKSQENICESICGSERKEETEEDICQVCKLAETMQKFLSCIATAVRQLEKSDSDDCKARYDMLASTLNELKTQLKSEIDLGNDNDLVCACLGVACKVDENLNVLLSTPSEVKLLQEQLTSFISQAQLSKDHKCDGSGLQVVFEVPKEKEKPDKNVQIAPCKPPMPPPKESDEKCELCSCKVNEVCPICEPRKKNVNITEPPKKKKIQANKCEHVTEKPKKHDCIQKKEQSSRVCPVNEPSKEKINISEQPSCVCTVKKPSKEKVQHENRTNVKSLSDSNLDKCPFCQSNLVKSETVIYVKLTSSADSKPSSRVTNFDCCSKASTSQKVVSKKIEPKASDQSTCSCSDVPKVATKPSTCGKTTTKASSLKDMRKPSTKPSQEQCPCFEDEKKQVKCSVCHTCKSCKDVKNCKCSKSNTKQCSKKGKTSVFLSLVDPNLNSIFRKKSAEEIADGEQSEKNKFILNCAICVTDKTEDECSECSTKKKERDKSESSLIKCPHRDKSPDLSHDSVERVEELNELDIKDEREIRVTTSFYTKSKAKLTKLCGCDRSRKCNSIKILADVSYNKCPSEDLGTNKTVSKSLCGCVEIKEDKEDQLTCLFNKASKNILNLKNSFKKMFAISPRQSIKSCCNREIASDDSVPNKHTNKPKCSDKDSNKDEFNQPFKQSLRCMALSKTSATSSKALVQVESFKSLELTESPMTTKKCPICLKDFNESETESMKNVKSCLERKCTKCEPDERNQRKTKSFGNVKVASHKSKVEKDRSSCSCTTNKLQHEQSSTKEIAICTTNIGNPIEKKSDQRVNSSKENHTSKEVKEKNEDSDPNAHIFDISDDDISDFNEIN